jgi:hypothetical protein
MRPLTDSLQNYPQILDGFVFSGLFGLRPLNGVSWYWNCLANLENLRVAADDYRPRQWVAPKDFFNAANTNNANIPAGKTNFYEFAVKPGSYLYGLTFAVFDDSLETTQFSVVIRRGGGKEGEAALSDRVFAASGITAGSPVDPFNTLYPRLDLLAEPLLIVAPGQMHVEISNDSNPADSEGNESCQLLMLFAEPK